MPILLLIFSVSFSLGAWANPDPKVSAAQIEDCEDSLENISEEEAAPVIRARIAQDLETALIGNSLENTPSIYRPASEEGRLRLATDEFLILSGARIRDPELHTALKDFAYGQIKLSDERLSPYQELLQDIASRSAALQRLEQTDTISHVEEALREDSTFGFQPRSVEEILRPEDSPWMRRVFKTRAPRIAFTNAPSFARALLDVEPKHRLRALRRSSRKMPYLSHFEIITILRVFPELERARAFNYLTERPARWFFQERGYIAGVISAYDIPQIARTIRLAPDISKMILSSWSPKRELPPLRQAAEALAADHRFEADAKLVLDLLDSFNDPEQVVTMDTDLLEIQNLLRDGVDARVQVDAVLKWIRDRKQISEASLMHILRYLPRGANWGWGDTGSTKNVSAYDELTALFVESGHTNWSHPGWEPMDRVILFNALTKVDWVENKKLQARKTQAYELAVDIICNSRGFENKKDDYKVQTQALVHHLIFSR